MKMYTYDKLLNTQSIMAVIRLGLNIEKPSDVNCSFSWSEQKNILEFGKKQSILPIVFRGLQRINSNSIVLNEYETDRLRCMHQYVNCYKELSNICTALNSSNIQYVILKGSRIGCLYPYNEFRTSSDIDILVRERQLEDAVLVIENKTDLKFLKKSYHDISFVNNLVHLELHFNLKENIEQIDRMLEKAWEYAVIASDGMGYEFTTEFNVFYIIAHMYYHFLNGGLGVRPFVDLWYIRNKTIFDENKVLHMCDACGIKKFYQECSFLPEVWFDERKHSKTSEMLEIVAIHGGLYGGEAFNYAVKQKSARGLKYLLNKLFPDSYHVSEFYKDPSGKKHILAYYYFKRLCSWSGKKRRKKLKKHVEGVFSVDKEQICFAKELLERLDI